VIKQGEEAFPETFTYMIVPVDDKPTENLHPYFESCSNFVDSAVETGGIYIHCAAGRSRSAAVLIAYLIWKD